MNNSIDKKIDKNSSLWNFLDPIHKDYLTDSVYLLEHFKLNPIKLNDYGFILFGIAKCYEGFLKKLFFTKRYINEDQYQSTKFRIGKILNPAIEERYINESVYDNLRAATGSNVLGNLLWETWRVNRNQVFHYFPDKNQLLSLVECEKRIDEIISAMRQALKTLSPETDF